MEERYGALSSQMDTLVHDANTKIQAFQAKIAGISRFSNFYVDD